MCVYSMIVQDRTDKWRKQFPWTTTGGNDQWPGAGGSGSLPFAPYSPPPAPTPEEIAEFRRLLEKAREYDKRTKQQDCESAEKIDQLRKIAVALGLNPDDVIRREDAHV